MVEGPTEEGDPIRTFYRAGPGVDDLVAPLDIECDDTIALLKG